MNHYGRIARNSLGSLAVAATLAFLVSGCSEIGYPLVHDMPAPRADSTLTPDQVKQATDDLISERDRLSTGTVPNSQGAAPNNAGRGSPKDASTNAAASPTRPVAVQTGVPEAPVTAGAYAKP